MKTNKQCFIQALSDYESLNDLLKNKTFRQCVNYCKKNNLDIFNEDGELFDLNYGTACFTINNENKMGIINLWIEVYNDDTGACLGVFSLDELKLKKKKYEKSGRII